MKTIPEFFRKAAALALFASAFLFAPSVVAETVNVSGVVTDSGGEGLIGVSVVVKDGNFGTTTDFDGNYELKGVDADAKIVFSYIGFRTVEEKINGRSKIDVTLEEDNQLLDEVVVVGP